MKIQSWMNLRMLMLVLLWVIPFLVYVTIGLVAMYENGWLWMVAVSLPFVWFTAWLVGRLWRPVKLSDSSRGPLLQAPDFWTPRDAAAIAIVEQYRAEAVDIDRTTITDPVRYQQDAEALATRLSEHYHGSRKENPLAPLTMIEIFAVIHLAIEDLEEWLLHNVPGSDLATIGQLSKLPELAQAFDGLQKIVYIASTIFNPSKLLAYPLWRKSGRVTIEIQNELIRGLYQRYLGLIGYYLIEMFSGRLRGGAKQYRERFGVMASAIHAADGQIEQLASVNDIATTIAVMGQVKAGKSSLINALIGDALAPTGVLPETRLVQRYEYPVPGSSNVVTLLDTPGYDEADVSKRQLREIVTASEAADLLLLVMAANVSARKADLAMVQQLDKHYCNRPHLKPPVIVVVLTHIDLLRPVREWNPPYDWRNPQSLKEQSIAGAVEYVRELFGDRISGYACVYIGNSHASDSSIVDEVVPQIIEHLGQGKLAAVLKAFYKQLGTRKLQRLLKQTRGLLWSAGGWSRFGVSKVDR
ncbi:MAG: dynamin family protein [Planctomycetota bacterium]|nr:dynamin family protein [Planctomycetota bacterium]